MQKKHISKKELPLGLLIIKNVYAIVAVISAYSAVFISPYSNVRFLGQDLGADPSVICNCFLIIFSLLLYLGFNRPTFTIWFLAFIYHIFFIVNNFLGVLSVVFPQSKLTAIIQISGKTDFFPSLHTEPTLKTSIQLFSLFNMLLLIGMFALWYLWLEREHFIPKRFLKKLWHPRR